MNESLIRKSCTTVLHPTTPAAVTGTLIIGGTTYFDVPYCAECAADMADPEIQAVRTVPVSYEITG